jgi:TonB family protein
MLAPRWIAPALTGLLLLLAGCGGGGDDPTAPPSGWSVSETRMWKSTVDTAAVFRDMNSLSAMGVLEEEVTLSTGTLTQQQFQSAIKRTLEELYRSNPTIVDSLFEAHAVPVLEEADLGSGAVEGGELNTDLRETNKQKALKAIDKHYEQPKIQEGITGLPYPDSLRTEENSGRVEVQLHITKDGTVDAVEVIDGTHPTLNTIVMKAATKTKWNPAFVTDGQEQVPHAGWGRLSTNFPAPR